MKLSILYIPVFALLSSFTLMNAQQVEKSVYGNFALTNANIETVTKGRLEGTILVSEGIISEVGRNVEVPSGYNTIDCRGLTVYPGMIDAGTQLGLTEVGSISLTRDGNELGDFTPHLEALTAINPNSVNIPVNRVSGVTTVISNPSGGRFPGTAALIDLVGYTPQQMYAGFKAVVMSFPSTGRSSSRDRRTDEEIAKQDKETMEKLNQIWERAEQYLKIKESRSEADGFDYQPEMDALVPVLKGETKLFVEVNRKEDIVKALEWLKNKKMDIVLTGVSDGWKVKEKIAKAGYPVITGPVLRNPSRSSDPYDAPYSNAAQMKKAGIKVAIRSNETENVRNLPYNAGFAATYGLGKEAALKAITIIPAEILGVDDRYGSIEKGKVANLFVTDGDPFETKTTVKHLFIRGWKVPLESRHTLLYDEFLERSPGLNK